MVISLYGLSFECVSPKGIDGVPNENRRFIAFSVERNSGMSFRHKSIFRLDCVTLSGVMRGLDPGLDPRIHLLREKVLTKIDGLPGQARQ
jgi:hypothetical protein